MSYDATDLSLVTEKNIAKVRAKENLARLRDFIGTLPDEAFDMTTWGNSRLCESTVKSLPVHKCGSVGCIGGWAKFFFNEDPEEPGNCLGLSDNQARALFYPDSISGWSSITRKQAMAALDNVIACGWPKWREIVKAA